MSKQPDKQCIPSNYILLLSLWHIQMMPQAVCQASTGPKARQHSSTLQVHATKVKSSPPVDATLGILTVCALAVKTTSNKALGIQDAL